jgi:hypothetical protein
MHKKYARSANWDAAHKMLKKKIQLDIDSRSNLPIEENIKHATILRIGEYILVKQMSKLIKAYDKLRCALIRSVFKSTLIPYNPFRPVQEKYLAKLFNYCYDIDPKSYNKFNK